LPACFHAAAKLKSAGTVTGKAAKQLAKIHKAMNKVRAAAKKAIQAKRKEVPYRCRRRHDGERQRLSGRADPQGEEGHQPRAQEEDAAGQGQDPPRSEGRRRLRQGGACASQRAAWRRA
jgi:hypothetical protein